MVCTVCKNPDGPCTVKKRDCSFFLVPLTEDFEDSRTVPCYVRTKINLLYYGNNIMPVQDSDGQDYLFKLQKLPDKTCITGHGWQHFLTDFNMEVGDMVLFEMSNNSYVPMKISACDAKCNFKKRSYVEDTSSGSSDEDSYDLEEVYGSHIVVVVTRNLDLNAQQKANWRDNVTHRGKGFGPLFVHKLTDTNTKTFQLKIPKKIVHPLQLEPSGVVVLSGDNTEDVQGQYNPCSDGRMLINFDAWEEFAKKMDYKQGKL